MAKRVHSHPLSALTEGHERYCLQTRRQAYETKHKYSGDSYTPFVTSARPNLDTETPVAAKRKIVEDSEPRIILPHISNVEHKRKIQNTKFEPISQKRRSYNSNTSNKRNSTPLIIDCIAHRTRSKTLYKTPSTSSSKEELQKDQLIEIFNPVDKTISTSTNSNNLFNYYRKTTKNNQISTNIKTNKISDNSDNTSEVSKSVLRKINATLKTSTREKAINLSSTQNSKKNKVKQHKRGGNCKLKVRKSKKNRNVTKSQKLHQNLHSKVVVTNTNRNFEIELDKDSLDERSYNLMAHHSQQLPDAGGGHPSTGEPSETIDSTPTASNSSIISHAESETDDNEVGRLQALLEARGLPPHLFGALGPRMTHILHRTIGSNGQSKTQQLIQGLQSQDESQQLQAAIEMCQMLVMGNEDTLAGFPIKQVVPALISLLRMDHNFDIMNNACRALAYMLEALPRSSGTVVEAIPVFLEKLQVIQCMDVAEQSLTALEILSRRHHKAILQANGVSACLTYLDFFSINAQRAAFSITANCCLNLNPEEFHFVSQSIPLLSRLLVQQDKKCVENICTAFCRLVEGFQHNSYRLLEIAANDFLKNCQQLLTATPSILNTGTFNSVIRMLTLICTNCSELAIMLLKNDIASTLLYLLTGSFEVVPSNNIELIPRSPSELFEITCLIEELMPSLPIDDIFAVNAWVERPSSKMHDQIQWQWRDDRGTWHSYSPIDSQMIDAAHLNSDDEISLRTVGRNYTVDFHSMQQINEETGTSRPVQRKINSNAISNTGLSHLKSGQDLSTSSLVASFTPTAKNNAISIDEINTEKHTMALDSRVVNLREGSGLEIEYIKKLFNVLYEVYSSSAGPNVRYKCLRALLRMTYYANSGLLKNVLKSQMVSSHIAGMMGSSDLRIVVGALQMAIILMKKLPDTFSIHFKREGVFHQVNQLANPHFRFCMDGTSDAREVTSSSKTLNQPYSFSNNCLPSTSKLYRPLQRKSFHCSSSPQTKKLTSPPSPSSSTFNRVQQINSFSAVESTRSETMPNTLDSVQHNIKEIKDPNIVNTGAVTTSFAKNENFFIYTMPSHDAAQYNNQQPETVLPRYQPRIKMFPSQISPSYATTENSESGLPIISSPVSNNSVIQNKMSDILKRKIPPKRKSQASHRPKSRQDEISIPGNVNQINGGDSISNVASIRSRASNNTSGNSNGNKSSFLSSLNPARWGRHGFHNNGFSKDPLNINSNLNKNKSTTNLLIADNREKARQWIHNQAITFIKCYTQQEISKSISGASILCRLSEIISKLQNNIAECIEGLKDLKHILIETDISPFEVNYSGLIKSMLNFMTAECGTVDRNDRLRAFLHVFAGLPLEQNIKADVLSYVEASAFGAFVSKLNACVTQLEQFPVKVHDIPSVLGGRTSTNALKFFNTHQLKCNLQRHPNCTNLRQWKGGTVKIDPLAMVQAIERYLIVRGYAGLRGEPDDDSEDDVEDNVAATNTLSSGLRHKLQFLIGDHVLPYNMTVYQAVKQFSFIHDNSETEAEPEVPLENTTIWVQHHTIYYRPVEEEPATSIGCSSSPTNKLTSCSTSMLGTTSSKKKSDKNSHKSIRKKNDFWHDGIILNIFTPLSPFLIGTLPANVVAVQDASLDALCMLRVLNALNRHWESLYGYVARQNLITQSEFVHPKLTAKANRQLQDPLVIITGNLPQWLQQISIACPFVFSFETRLLLFYAISFDRDRALHRLFETTPELNSSDTSERVAPRLDRCKRIISRDDILKQAEQIMHDVGHLKSLLEIQYENEVGTGLGPTLEFYALVSSELQRSDLCLWTDSNSYRQNSSLTTTKPISTHTIKLNEKVLATKISPNVPTMKKDNSSAEESIESNSVYEQRNPNMRIKTDFTLHRMDSLNYVNTSNGLFPLPTGKTTKLAQVLKAKAKFKFLGKFIAKAVMDSRMVDLPFSVPFYRWLLKEEHLMGLGDLVYIAPEVHGILLRLQGIVNQRDCIQLDPNLNATEKTYQLETLDLDGCLIADLGLNFVLPGHSSIELRRGGRDISVTIHNLHQYISLVTHWFLVEGVQKQFEFIKEGFNTVFPLHTLQYFYPEELEDVFCGSSSSNYIPWDTKMLQECCRADHGYTQNSKAILFLFDILASYNNDEQRQFLQFVTGSPRLPTGGFKSLNPPLTIVRKTLDADQNPNDYLPSVMTCVNYLKLPEYTTYDIMKDKLKIAANEGSKSFHLS